MEQVMDAKAFDQVIIKLTAQCVFYITLQTPKKMRTIAICSALEEDGVDEALWEPAITACHGYMEKMKKLAEEGKTKEIALAALFLQYSGMVDWEYKCQECKKDVALAGLFIVHDEAAPCEISILCKECCASKVVISRIVDIRVPEMVFE